MDIEILDSIKRNSGINESSSIDISRTQEILSKLIDEQYNDSLAFKICNIIELNSSWGTIFVNKKKFRNADPEVVKKDIYTKLYKLKTGYTTEALQDMYHMFGSSISDKISKIFSGITAEDENYELMRLIDNESSIKSDLTINVGDSCKIPFIISEKVSASVIEMNRNTFKTLDSFCILPPKYASYFLGSNFYNDLDKDTLAEKGSYFVGRYGRTDFFINPVTNGLNAFNIDYADDYANGGANINYCYVGLKSDITDYSSLIFSPYQYEIQEITNPETGSTESYVYNRYGLNTNPLHQPLENNSMIHKFLIV